MSAVGAFPSKSHLRRARSPALPCIVAALGGEACACRRARARSALRTVSFSRRFQMWVMWVMWVMVPNFFVTYSLSVVLSGGSRARPRYVRDRYQKPCYGGRYSSYAIRVKRFQIRGLAEKKRKPFQLQRLSRKSCNGLTSPTSPTCEWFTLYHVYIILQPKPHASDRYCDCERSVSIALVAPARGGVGFIPVACAAPLRARRSAWRCRRAGASAAA